MNGDGGLGFGDGGFGESIAGGEFGGLGYGGTGLGFEGGGGYGDPGTLLGPATDAGEPGDLVSLLGSLGFPMGNPSDVAYGSLAASLLGFVPGVGGLLAAMAPSVASLVAPGWSSALGLPAVTGGEVPSFSGDTGAGAALNLGSAGIYNPLVTYAQNWVQGPYGQYMPYVSEGLSGETVGGAAMREMAKAWIGRGKGRGKQQP
jgi:hypothetical protein